MLLFTSVYSTGKCGLGLISILAFFQYWQHILNERVVTYNLKTHADDGLLITWSLDNINTCSGGADKPSLKFEGIEWYNSEDCGFKLKSHPNLSDN